MDEKLEAQRGKELSCGRQKQTVNLGRVTEAQCLLVALPSLNFVSFYIRGSLTGLCLFWTQYRINVYEI